MKKIAMLWTAAPVAALVAVSLASAQTATLSTFYTVDSNSAYNNHLIYSCQNDGAYWELRAQAFNGCGSVTANTTQSVIGETGSTRFSTSSGGPCAPTAKQHQVDIVWHWFDPKTGNERILSTNGSRGKSGCWNSDYNAGTCLSTAKTSVWGWVEGVQSNVCDNGTANGHWLTAYSLGSTSP